MSDVDDKNTEHLADLAKRWELDKGSRVFVQLAEEYRRAGRVSEALAVLEDGLERHPEYLAAHVALGRCRLETGQAAEAAQVLEDVVRRDPTQMVAYKLLVEAYLAEGQAAEARNRLSRYTLLNDSDPETEALERRIQTLVDQDRSTPNSPDPARSGSSGAGDPFPLLVAGPEDKRKFLEGLDAEGLFGLPPLAATGAAETPNPAAPTGSDEAEREVDSTVSTVADEAPSIAEDEPAIEAETHDSERQVALAQIDATPESAAPTDSRRVRDPNDPFDLSGPPTKTTDAGGPFAFSPTESSASGADGAEPETSPVAEESGDVATGAKIAGAAAVAGAATVTLGRIYQKQGHRDEAERIFRQILDRDPDDAEARDALAELTEAEATASLEEVGSSASEPTEAMSTSGFGADDAQQDDISADQDQGLTAKKIQVLKQYRERLRRGSHSDVH